MKPVIHLITTISMGGAEKQLLTLTAEQVTSGREVTVVYLKGKPELSSLFVKSGVKIISDFSDRNPIVQAYLLRRFFRNHKESLLHAHLPRAELFSTLAPANIKIVLSRHNAEPFYPGAPKAISRLLSRYVAKRATSIVAISEAVKSYLIDCKEVVNPNKIKVVYYGFNRTENYESGNEPQLNDIEDRGTVIGTIARLVPQKDLGTLIRAFENFQKENPDAALIIVGEGPLKNQLNDLVKKLGIESNVIWYGRTPNVNAILRKFDLFALTSLYEGFGLVLLEAMANGVPVVAARNSAIPEVLGLDYEGLFQTGDHKQLSELLKSSLEPSQSSKMREYLKERLEIFQPDRMRIKMDEIYLLQEKK
jgi:glycosyltransferase involved in cell wall biosynthesis